MLGFPRFCFFCICTVSSCCAASLVIADETDRSELEEIIITSHPLYERGAAQSLSVIGGDELAEKVQGSLGETVSSEPGIHSASFGVAVGRPVIHGLGGARVKTTQDRIDSLDVSVTSSDHAVAIEPFIANQINILKGASTLIYGTGAIGGVVDIETGRIPKRRPKKPLQGRLELRLADNANAHTGALRLDGQAGNHVAWHLDAFDKQGDDYDIPGFIRADALRQSGDQQRDVLAGSNYASSGGALGMSYIGPRGRIGLAYSRIDADYGLIIAQPEEVPGKIVMQQDRLDFDAHLDSPFDGFLELNVRFGRNDYQHQEIESSGELGTLFENDAWEGRIELAHMPLYDFAGQIGLQINQRKFSALGEEAFVQPVDSSSAGLFWVGERSFESFDLESGLRLEKVQHKPLEGETGRLDFSVASASVGVVKRISDVFTVSALLDYSERAPAIEELYSNGAHLATQTFEVGDLNLRPEAALAATLTFNYQSERFATNLSIYHMDFEDFIYQQNSGAKEDGLPVLNYQQDDATFTGLDFEATARLGKLVGGKTSMSLLADLVNAQVKVVSNRNLPRIPAARIGAGLAWDNVRWQLSFKYLRVARQTDVASFERATDAYDDFSLRITRRFTIGGNDLGVSFHGRNLSNQEQRHHTSFIKDLAPAPGRRMELAVRYQF